MPLPGSGPFPLPMFELPRQTGSRSRRVQQRHRYATVVNRLANEASSTLNKLFLSNHTTQTSNSSILSSRLAQNVRSAAARFVSRCAPCGASCDDIFDSPFSSSYVATSSAVPLDARKVSLPTEGGLVDLLSILPPDVAAKYATPNPGLFRAQLGRRPARAVLFKSAADWVAVVRSMAEKGMVVFTTKPKCMNGVFATAKDSDRQRLIIDARPANRVFADPPAVRLANPEVLAELQVPAGREFFVAKVDLDNFYHRLRTPTWMWEYFALPPVRAADVGEGERFGADSIIYPCCTTLPMGWSHSVFLAQTAHVFILDTQTSLSCGDRLQRGGDLSTMSTLMI